jgi:hypothetical protein
MKFLLITGVDSGAHGSCVHVIDCTREVLMIIVGNLVELIVAIYHSGLIVAYPGIGYWLSYICLLSDV